MRILAVCLLVISGLAGCTDPEPDAGQDPEPTAGPSPDPKDDPVDPGTPDPGSDANASNTPPTASLTVSATSGPAPLNVTFGINGTDGDGDALDWTLDLDGDGVADANGSVPASFVHTFAAGNHTVNLTVTDGQDEATDSIELSATAVTGPQPLVFTGDVSELCDTSCEPVCDPQLYCYVTAGAMGCKSYVTSEPGGDCTWFMLPPEAAGRPFLLASTGGDPDMQFQESCDVKDEAPAEVPGEVVSFDDFYAANGAETGTVPSGKLCAVVWEWEAAPSTLTLTVS